MEIPKNLQAGMRRVGITSANALSRLSGVPQPTISRTLKGETIPETATLRKLALVLQMSLADLTAEEPGEMVNKVEQKVATYDAKTRHKQRVPVPVISLIRAGHLKEIGELPAAGEGDQWESPDGKLGSRGWAHIVEGDSMDDGTDKGIPEGWLIFVDPDLAPSAGNFVIAKDVSTQSATFKKLTFDAGRWYLKPLNRQYQAIEIDSPELRVIGVVTEARTPSRKLV